MCECWGALCPYAEKLAPALSPGVSSPQHPLGTDAFAQTTLLPQHFSLSYLLLYTRQQWRGIKCVCTEALAQPGLCLSADATFLCKGPDATAGRKPLKCQYLGTEAQGSIMSLVTLTLSPPHLLRPLPEKTSFVQPPTFLTTLQVFLASLFILQLGFLEHPTAPLEGANMCVWWHGGGRGS